MILWYKWVTYFVFLHLNMILWYKYMYSDMLCYKTFLTWQLWFTLNGSHILLEAYPSKKSTMRLLTLFTNIICWVEVVRSTSTVHITNSTCCLAVSRCITWLSKLNHCKKTINKTWYCGINTVTCFCSKTLTWYCGINGWHTLCYYTLTWWCGINTWIVTYCVFLNLNMILWYKYDN